MKDRGRAEGARDLTLEVGVENGAAVALYESLGFRHERHVRDYYGPGKDAWKMRLNLQRQGAAAVQRHFEFAEVGA